MAAADTELNNIRDSIVEGLKKVVELLVRMKTKNDLPAGKLPDIELDGSCRDWITYGTALSPSQVKISRFIEEEVLTKLIRQVRQRQID